MTDENLPEIVESEIVEAEPMLSRRTDSWTAIIEPVADLANKIAGTTFVPEGLRGNVGGTAAGILYGREVGLPPMTTLQTMHVIKGRVGVSAEALRALVLRAGHEIVIRESTNARCVMAGRRKGSEDFTTVEWTTEDAKRAGLGGEGWKKYPRAMLQARASAELCRLVFPDVIHGMAATEELESTGGDAVASTSGTSKATKRVSRRKKQPEGESSAELPPLPDEADYETPQAGTSDGPSPDPASDAPTADSAGAAPSTPAESATPNEDDEASEPGQITGGQMRMLQARLRELEIEDRAERLSITADLLGRSVESANELTKAEAGTLIDTLATCETRADLERVIQAAVSARDASQTQIPIDGDGDDAA